MTAPPPPVRVAFMELQATIEPDEQTIRAIARLRLRGTGRATAPFFLQGSLVPERATANEHELVLQRVDVSPPPFLPGASAWRFAAQEDGDAPLTLELAYGGRLPGTYCEVNRLDSSWLELAIYAAWYPVFPDGGVFPYTLSVDLPRDFVALSQGCCTHSEASGARRRERWQALVPSPDIVVVGGRDLATLRRREGRQAIELLCPKRSAALLRPLLEAGQRVLRLFRSRFGSIDNAQTLRIAVAPRGGWPYARPGLVVLPEQQAQGRLAEPGGLHEQVHEIAHEIAHFWWRLADVSSSDDWINEALAEYSALRASEHCFGYTEAQRRVAAYRQRIEQAAPSVPLIETTPDSPDRRVNWYERGALLFRALEIEVGRDEFDRFLADLCARTAPGTLTTQRLEALVRSSFGASLAAVMDRWLRTTDLPEPR